MGNICGSPSRDQGGDMVVDNKHNSKGGIRKDEKDEATRKLPVASMVIEDSKNVKQHDTADAFKDETEANEAKAK